MKTWKSTGAILCGLLINGVFATGTDTILEAVGIFPPLGEGLFDEPLLALALSYRLVYSFVGGYVTAWLVPLNGMRNVTMLGIIGTVLALIGMVVGWDLSQRWYPLALAVTAFPVTWAGGRVRMHPRAEK